VNSPVKSGIAASAIAVVISAGLISSSDAAVGPTDVTGTETHSVARNSTTVQLKSDTTPTGNTEGTKLVWEIYVGPSTGPLNLRLKDTMGAGEQLDWKYTFAHSLSTRQVQIKKNGVLVAAYTFKP
jgi:hypothetical protein